jgi:hypothetical protein
MHYNFCRPHMSLKGKTPAQAAGVTSRVWTVADMVRLLEEAGKFKELNLTHYRSPPPGRPMVASSPRKHGC